MINICTYTGDDLYPLFPPRVFCCIFSNYFRSRVSNSGISIAVFGLIYKGESSSKPPSYKEEPEHNDEKNNVPQPAAALLRSHIVHSSKSSRKD